MRKGKGRAGTPSDDSADGGDDGLDAPVKKGEDDFFQHDDNAFDDPFFQVLDLSRAALAFG